MLVSPAEPAAFRALGEVSSITETKYGVDFLYTSAMGMVGVQRKEYSDLLSSVMHSDRLYRELKLMKELDVGIFLIEGRPQWTTDGWLTSRQRWSYKEHRGVILSLQLHGFWVYTTESLEESIRFLSELHLWLEKEAHKSLDTRPNLKPSFGDRRMMTREELGCHIIQSFPNIGPTVAQSLYRHFQGVPLAWTATYEELKKVPGVGPVRARKMIDALANQITPISARTSATSVANDS